MHVVLATASSAAASALAVPLVQLPADLEVQLHLANNATAVQQVHHLLQVSRRRAVSGRRPVWGRRAGSQEAVVGNARRERSANKQPESLSSRTPDVCILKRACGSRPGQAVA